MASTYADVDDVSDQQQQQLYRHHHQQAPSPKSRLAPSPKGLMRACSMSSSSWGGDAGAGGPRCVCAPATHARSFKCRLHRTNSHGHSTSSSAAAAPPQPPQRPVSASAAPTVEAL